MIAPTIAIQAVDGDGEITDWFEVQVRVEGESVDFARVGGARRGVTWMCDLIAAERKRAGSEA